jgi:DNA recombination protein RmuC
MIYYPGFHMRSFAMTPSILFIMIAVAAGIVAALLFSYFWRTKSARIAAELMGRSQEDKARELEAILERVKGSFAILSQEALGRSVNEFLKLAAQTLQTHVKDGEKELEGKKKLIDQNLKSMTEEMERVRALLKEFEKERSQQYGALVNQLRTTGELTAKLEHTTGELTTALSSSQQRGQWGERMAEDVLRLAGFIEGIQYRKQKQIEGAMGRPDFTFYLPQKMIVNMDVKFPLDNYLHYVSAKTDAEKERSTTQFIRDVQNRVKELTGREYIDPTGGTLDYVLMFIPNEQVYAFIHEHAPELIDGAMKKKVVICSPITLYAILAVIRQAVENFNLEQKTAHILSLLGSFLAQWGKFTEGMDKMGKRILEAEKEYEALMSTRRNALERPLRKIDELRQQKGIEIASLPPGEGGDLAPGDVETPPEETGQPDAHVE